MIRWFLRGVSRSRRDDALSPGRGAAAGGFRARALLDPDAIDQHDAAALAAACLPGALTRRCRREPAARRQPLHRLRAVRRREPERGGDDGSGLSSSPREP